MFDDNFGSLNRYTWELFTQTGQIGYYLLFKQLQQYDDFTLSKYSKEDKKRNN